MLNKIKKILSVILILISTVVAVSASGYFVEDVHYKESNPIYMPPLKDVLKNHDITTYNKLYESNSNLLNRVIGYYENEDGITVFRIDNYKIWTVGNALYIHDMRMSEEYKLTLIYTFEDRANERCRNFRHNMEIILDERGIDYLDAYIHRINWLVEKLGDYNDEDVFEYKDPNEKYKNSKNTIRIRNNRFDKNFFRAGMTLTKDNLRALGIKQPDKYSLEYDNLKFGETL